MPQKEIKTDPTDSPFKLKPPPGPKKTPEEKAVEEVKKKEAKEAKIEERGKKEEAKE